MSDEDFNALKEAVQKLTEKVQTLEGVHEEDQAKIRDLQSKHDEAPLPAAQQVPDAKQFVPPSTGLEAPAATDLGGPLATHSFTIVGDAEVQFAKIAHKHGAFAFADFAPIFLFRANENILFEAGFDFVLQNNAPGGSGYTTTVNLSFATIDYLLNDYVTVTGGNMLLPLGTYSERSAGWLNKIPDNPMVRDILPGTGVGAQLRGAIPVGDKGSSVTYSAFAVNGPGSVDGTGNAGQLDTGGNVGLTLAGDTANLHGGMGWGGRIAFFHPWKAQHDLEVGISGMSSSWDDAGRRQYTAGVVDLAMHLGPSVEIKGEYVHTWVETDDLGTIKPNGWWVQAGYKLSGMLPDVPYLNNVELMGRYDTLSDAMGTRTNRGTVGAVYYLSNTLWLEGDYEWTGNHGPNPAPSNSLIFQLSYGF
ncbi:MAG: hypothetical protein ABJF10_29670 [Chthoniobacter sp.]|uniref:hypothetical protein n=1 Tax=Chthoniobacter sp. TaxID=2510640 RepID=UPI0032AAA99C